MKKATPLFVLIGIVLVITVFITWFGTRWYGSIDSVQEVTVLFSHEEVFVFIAHGKAILSENRGLLLAKQLASVMQFPDHIKDDLLVAHLKNGKVLQYDLADFGFGGAPFVRHDEVYWRRGRERGDTGPTRWRWNGSNFVQLSEHETLLLAQSKDIDATTRSEEWNQQSFQTGWDYPEVKIHLRNGYVRVYAEKQSYGYGKNDRLHVILDDLENTNATTMLIDIIEGYRQISKSEYLKLKSQKPGNN